MTTNKDKKDVKSEKQDVIERVDCDTRRLYGTIPEAIKYLQEMYALYPFEDFSLEEHWIGYEDMNMCFSYVRKETDEEFGNRLKTEEMHRKFTEQTEKATKEREKRRKQYQRLKGEFG